MRCPLQSEFEAALTAILLRAVHRFLSAFKADCSLKIFPDSNQRILLLTSESFYLFRQCYCFPSFRKFASKVKTSLKYETVLEL
ncbi:hypothetical protein T12_13492 [Trichinella patagoniensis]|uniref:Uncharacterized protein n=1 Tax=Trichinella patagoniensis TaxID=990121 RepID=A0A0V0Z6P5_9BILA|nr:hypothetical protein T12_13492 [Trichinella patagoniensis]